jgi:hypothetical protein
MRTTEAENIKARFEEKFQPEPNSGCWLWLGAIDGHEYPIFRVGGKRRLGHRVAYELYRGPIPPKYDVHHKCKTPLCVNPEHLEALARGAHTLLGNNIVGQNARKTHCEKGHPFDGDNVRIVEGRRRACRTCDRERMREVRRVWKEDNPDRRLRSGERTHYPKGHPYSGDNLGVRFNGWRVCRACDRTGHQLKAIAQKVLKTKKME